MSRLTMFFVAFALAAPGSAALAGSPTTKPTECPFRFHINIIPPATQPLCPRTRMPICPEPPGLMPFAPASGQIVPGRDSIPKDWIREEFNGQPFYIIPCSG